MTADSDKKYKDLDAFVKGVQGEFEDRLASLVEIPTISMDPSHKPDITRGAELAASYLKDAGATGVEILETAGNPVIIGKLATDPNNPTVTIYNHIDVQPAQEPEWTRDPFKFGRQDGKYLGRGSTDDKGPAMTALTGARYAFENGVPVNINFLWELEEEIGSPSFEACIKANADKLKTDSIVVSDTIWISRGKPAIPYGLRGVQGLTLSLETHTTDIHSGTTGGVARNPLGELAQVIAACYDAKTGKVKIPGFYKDVRPVTKAEIQQFTSAGFSMKGFFQAHKLKSARTKDPAEALKRIFAMPTFEVHGLVGGYTGPGIKTVIPPRGEAKISMRLVPNQKTAKIASLAEKFVKSVNKDVKVKRENALEPYLGVFTGPYAEAASAAMKFAFGKTPAFTREGGSIGAVVTMEKYLKAPIVFLGLSLPEHGYHAPNEFFDWEQASGGIKMFVKYFDSISSFARK